VSVRAWRAGGGAVAVVAAVVGVVALASRPEDRSSAAQQPPPSTAVVERGDLSATVAGDGTLTYRGEADGSPTPIINQATGVYTALPETGDRVSIGGVLYRVDDRPVVLLRGAIPSYRALRAGDVGRDVRQLNRTLHALGYDAKAHVRIAPTERTFSSRTAAALAALQRTKGMPATGRLARGAAVFMPDAIRVARVIAVPGGTARPGAPVVGITSGALQVQVEFEASDQSQIHRGDRAEITLPGHGAVKGRVVGFGRVARAASEQGGGSAADATIVTSISLDDPSRARGLERAPAQVEIRTGGARDALSVPVTALVGKAGGGVGVERVSASGRRDVVAVRLGLFDTAGGRVQVDGDLQEGDRVVVPSL
jgi:hypothetical protein